MRYIDNRKAWKRIRKALDDIGEELASIWHEGDGQGAMALKAMIDAAERHGAPGWPDNYPVIPTIPRRIRIQAMERDGMKCRECGTVHDLRCARLPSAGEFSVKSADHVITLCVHHVWIARSARVAAAQ